MRSEFTHHIDHDNEPLAEQSVETLLEKLGSTELPGGGGGAAISAATAASLTEMAARLAGSEFTEREIIVGRAAELRRQALTELENESRAYAQVLAAQRRVRQDKPEAVEGLRSALIAASEGPLWLAELSAEVAVLAGRLARDGNPAVFADAVAGVLMATAAARTAEHIVSGNLGGMQDQLGMVGRGQDAAARATATERLVMSLKVPAVPIPVTGS